MAKAIVGTAGARIPAKSASPFRKKGELVSTSMRHNAAAERNCEDQMSGHSGTLSSAAGRISDGETDAHKRGSTTMATQQGKRSTLDSESVAVVLRCSVNFHAAQ